MRAYFQFCLRYLRFFVARSLFLLFNKGSGPLLLHTAARNKFVLPAEAGIQRLKSLDYSIHPCMLPFGPAFGCSNLLQADLVQPKTCWNDGI